MGPRNREKQRKELSQAEIWDDSALVQSWDDALAEYKKYHSIHARGERVEDVIKAFESNVENPKVNSGIASGSQADTSGNGANDDHLEELEDGELNEGEVGDSTDYAIDGVSHNLNHEQTHQETSFTQQSLGRDMPSAVAEGVKDEALKNLMMSWYYAGYYTGLYEG